MILVHSSDDDEEEVLFSDDSVQTIGIFPMAKPPSDADYDASFIQLVEDAMMAKIHPSQSDKVEQGRNNQSTLDEIPLLLLQDNSMIEDDQTSLPELKDMENSNTSLPPWLCLDNDQEMNHFKVIQTIVYSRDSLLKSLL